MKTPVRRAIGLRFPWGLGNSRTNIAPAGGFVFALLWLVSCHPSKPVFSPLPPQVTSIEGYASLKLNRNGETTRVRFSFLFLVPEEGRVEIQDSIRRTVASLFLMKESALLVLPSHRAYWQAEPEVAMEKLLGFDIRQEEIAEILQGKGDNLTGWDVERDERQRVIRAERGKLRIEVREYFASTNLPQRLFVSQDGQQGHLKILRLRFNQPLRKGVFDLSFLKGENYSSCTWDEIERLIRNEN